MIFEKDTDKMFNLSFIENILKNVKINYFNRDNHLLNDCFDFFIYYASYCDKEEISKILRLKDIFLIQKEYIEAFFNMKNRNFYEAWCLLEKVEKNWEFLMSNPNGIEKYNINFIKEYTLKFKKLFPYKLFLSPELIYKKFECNICGQEYTLKKRCNHKVGEIYNGKRCTKKIKDCEIIGLALVENPVQEYSVVFLNGKDNYNYQLIKNLIKNLESPFHEWEYEISEELHPHSEFSDVDREDNCPCGSGETYGQCCLNKKGVLLKHYHFTLL